MPLYHDVQLCSSAPYQIGSTLSFPKILHLPQCCCRFSGREFTQFSKNLAPDAMLLPFLRQGVHLVFQKSFACHNAVAVSQAGSSLCFPKAA